MAKKKTRKKNTTKKSTISDSRKPSDATIGFEKQLWKAADALRSAGTSLESRQLASLCDTLLPKLISGEIRVLEAEQALAEVN